jgi:hypothetical protein
MIFNGLFKSNQHEVLRGFLLIVCAFSGGYLIFDFPEEFLKLYTYPFVQFLIFFSINYASRKKFRSNEIKWIFAEAVISVAILQAIKYVVYQIYGPGKR